MSDLDWLIQRLRRIIAAATTALEGRISESGAVDAWQSTVTDAIGRYSLAAMMTGSGDDQLSPEQLKAVKKAVQTQATFLDAFALEIQGAAAWQAGWNARAEMYASSIKAPYWTGKVKMLPLPAMPGDGSTQCLTNCGCAWDIQQLDGEGNYDCYWRRGKNDSCQTCVGRSARWAPLRIRDGEIV